LSPGGGEAPARGAWRGSRSARAGAVHATRPTGAYGPFPGIPPPGVGIISGYGMGIGIGIGICMDGMYLSGVCRGIGMNSG
jgi:hypothetical protein